MVFVSKKNSEYQILDYDSKENRLSVICDDARVRYTKNPEIFFIDIKFYRYKTINQILE